MSAIDPAIARLFFALVPDDAVRGRIAAAAAALTMSPDSRQVPSDNYHLTLAFLGDVAESQLSILRQIGASQQAGPMRLSFTSYEYWPKPEVVVAAARIIPQALQYFWESIHSTLADHGWVLAPKRLRPHITLVRKVAHAPVLAAALNIDWTAREFCLMRSDLGTERTVYTVVDTWPLLDKDGES